MDNTETYTCLPQYNISDIKKGSFSINGKELIELDYVIIDDKAIFQGDIILGNAEEIEKKQELLLKNSSNTINAAEIVGKRWRNYTRIPYEINCIVNQDRIRGAIRHIEEKTTVKFALKTDGDIDYITIINDITGKGSSNIGCQGGQQVVHLNRDGNFLVGNVVHELCHALGLWHEHSRQDRDAFIRIHPENILEDKKINFEKCISEEETDYKLYDYNSIMHYGQYAFRKNRDDPNARTIITVDDDYQDKIGQRNGLSDTDISALNNLG